MSDKKYFLDKTCFVSRQTFDMAAITDSKGEKVGRVIVRYTDSQIGYNNETGVGLYVSRGSEDLDIRSNVNETIKGNTYDRSSLYRILTALGAKCYGHNNNRFHSYNDDPKLENSQNIDSTSQITEMRKFKIGNSIFNIHWC